MPPLGQALPTGECEPSPNLLYFNYLRNPISMVGRMLPNWLREEAGSMELNYPDCPFICPPSHRTGSHCPLAAPARRFLSWNSHQSRSFWDLWDAL